jgi:hypothetical protein
LFLWTGQSQASHPLWLAWCPSCWGSASYALRWTASGTSTITAPAVAKRLGFSFTRSVLSSLGFHGFFIVMKWNSAGGWVQEVWPLPRRRCGPVVRAELRRAWVAHICTVWYRRTIAFKMTVSVALV